MASLISRRRFLAYGEAAAIAALGSTLTGCRRNEGQRVQSVTGSARSKQSQAKPSALTPRLRHMDAKEFKHAGDQTTSWWEHPADQVKLYGLVDPTLTLVKEPDTNGNLTFYATMVWKYQSYGWATYYLHSNTPPPDIAIRFINIDSNGNIGTLYRWDIGKVNLFCTPVPDSFFKTSIEPDLYNDTLNWLPDFTDAYFYKVC